MRARRENNIEEIVLCYSLFFLSFFSYFLVKLFFRKYRLGIHIHSMANKKLPPSDNLGQAVENFF